jgi:hypothetical protein
MHALKKSFKLSCVAASIVAATMLSGCGVMEKMGMGGNGASTATLSGAHEVPPVSTKAMGKSTITVADDRTVTGSVIVTDMMPTAAHIHTGAPGANGPVTIPLEKKEAMVFSVPANTKMTDEQYTQYKAGNLYINVHSAAYPAGEIRVQMKP